MSTIKNGQITLYCCFNKIIKKLGNSLKSTAWSQKQTLEMCVMQNTSI